MGIEIKNTPRTPWILTGAVLVTLMLLSLVAAVPTLLTATLVVLFAPLFILLIWWQHYHQRPMHVRIETEGIWLYFKHKEAQFAPWFEIERLIVSPFDMGQPSLLQTTKGGTMVVKAEVARAVREAYANVMGKVPPIEFEQGGFPPARK